MKKGMQHMECCRSLITFLYCLSLLPGLLAFLWYHIWILFGVLQLDVGATTPFPLEYTRKVTSKFTLQV